MLDRSDAVLTSLQPRASRLRVVRGLEQFATTKPLGAISAVTVIVLILIAIFAPIVAPYKPDRSFTDNVLAGPSAKHWFGGDNNGRDVFSRIVYGTRISFQVGFGSVLLGTTVAAVIGLVSGYLGGAVDLFIQRIVDMFMAFPSLILLLLIVAVFGQGLDKVIYAIALSLAIAPSRVVRGAVIVERGKTYVEAARVLGAGPLRILSRHILVNVLPVIIVIASLAVGAAILIEAGLSFIGLGVPPPAVSWGRMIGAPEARSYFIVAPWLAIFPGLALSVTIWSLNMLGDAIRDVLDPRLRGMH
jgi:peptide/nickel transport system permease protein